MTVLPTQIAVMVTASLVRAGPLGRRWWPASWPPLQAHALPGSQVPWGRQAPDCSLAEALAQALQPWVGTRSSLQVILGDEHCRYLGVPRVRHVRSRAELLSVLDARFDESFDPTLESWTRSHHLSLDGHPDFVVGVRSSVLSEVRRVAAALGTPLRRVSPAWTANCQRAGGALRKGEHWVISCSGARATVGYLAGGRCLHARSVPLTLKPNAWQHVLAREQALIAPTNAVAEVWLATNRARLEVDTALPGRPVHLMDSDHFWWRDNLPEKAQ